MKGKGKMFIKKAKPEQTEKAVEKLSDVFGNITVVDDVPVKEYMIKWLSAFAPDMALSDAKAFCLPRRMYKNYLWHAFSFQKTASFVDEDAKEAFKEGFFGQCFVLMNEENILCSVDSVKDVPFERIEELQNVIIFTKDFTETFVYTGKEGFGPYYKSVSMTEIDDAEPLELEEAELSLLEEAESEE